MKDWLSKVGLRLFRVTVIYIVLYLLAIFVIKPEIPRSNISFFCWLTALISADLEEIKNILNRNGENGGEVL